MKCDDLNSASSSIQELRGALPDLPQDAEGPVFKEPWEAQAFAMTLALHERKLFTWNEWAETLSQAIRGAQAAGDPDTGENYYQHWLVALERITTKKGLVNGSMLAHRKEEWVDAARRTPHGMPIELKHA
jgi:nitrile hydratase accessory protein